LEPEATGRILVGATPAPREGGFGGGLWVVLAEGSGWFWRRALGGFGGGLCLPAGSPRGPSRSLSVRV